MQGQQKPNNTEGWHLSSLHTTYQSSARWHRQG